MFTALFNIIINLLASIIQIICWPINQVIVSTMPDISNWITSAVNGINSIISYMAWAVGALPPIVIEMLIFVLLVEIAKHTIFKSTHILNKIWTIIQKVKFW